MDRGYFVNRKTHPKESASVFSLLTFRYIHELVRKGNKEDLQEDDICEIYKKFQINKLGDKSTETWYHQAKSSKGRSISKHLATCFLKKFLLIGLFQLIVKILNVIVVPYSFGQLIKYFKHEQKEITKQDACYYGALVVLTNLFCLVYDHQYILYKSEFSMSVSSSLCSLLYRKILRLSSTGISDISTGKIVSVVTKDISMIEDSTFLLNDIWIESAQGLIVFYLLFNKVGFPAIFGVGCYGITIVIQGIIAKVIYKERSSVNLKSDKRLKLIQEVLSSIRVIKMYTWEKFFSSRVTYARDQEVRKFGTMTFIKFVSIFLGNFCDKISFFTMIAFYLYLGNNLTAEVVYYSEICFQRLNSLVTYIMTTCASITAEFFASVHRIEFILNAEEIDDSLENSSRSFILPKVEFFSANINYGDVLVLRNINLKLGPGLNILVGPMGCGKSSLLKSILGEFPLISGKLTVEGTISYVPQNPWIFPSSIKQNILFGQAYDENKYKKVLDVCALTFDLNNLTEKDETIIKDCDMNLSKGQQARINIARALYKESDIYIFDDPLAALDNRVRSYIFQEIRKYLKNKLVILATNETNFINEANTVIVMLKGKVTFIGKPKNTPKHIFKSLSKQETTKISPFLSAKDSNSEEEIFTDKSKLKPKDCSSQKANIYHEGKETGSGAGWKGYVKYFKYGGGAKVFIMIMALYGLVEASSGSSEKLLSKWVEIEENFTSTVLNSTSTSDSNYRNSNAPAERMFYLNWYTCLVLMSCILVTTSISVHFIFSLKISRNLHKAMIRHLMGSTMSFFDQNMSGNILNRFSKDVFQVDEFLPFFIGGVMMTCTSLFTTAILISSVNLEFTVLTIGLVLIYFATCRYFLRPVRNLKKLENSTRSPMVGHFGATLEGLVTIRAFGKQQILMKEFDKHQDLFISSRHLFEITTRCLAFTVNLFSTSFTSLIIVRFLSEREGESSADVGLAVTQSFVLSTFFDNGIMIWVFLESLMVCFQRASEYTEIKQENQTGHIIENWPSEGCIEYKNVILTYKKDNEIILKNIDFTIKPKEKIGVVGRTGAGKSSLILTLFRLYEIEGRILIDDIDIKTVPIDYLRSGIAVIPQDPLIFSGSVRENIDPFVEYSDNQIWRALSIVGLKSHIRTLDEDIDDVIYTMGQKQLVCLARAVIRKAKIVILDEATANMDEETEILIHQKFSELFTDCTVLMVAHRLKFVMNCDRVIVMEKGEVVEFESPQCLMQNVDSVFYKMVNYETNY